MLPQTPTPTPSTDRAADPVQDLLHALNPEQRAAAAHTHGPAVVLAGAGSGKTRVLTARIARLVRQAQVRPARILAVTFTNKAAGEMRARLEQLLGPDASPLVMGTFHAWGARFLRQHGEAAGLRRGFTILDADDTARLWKRIFAAKFPDAKTPGGAGSSWNADMFRGKWSDAKNALQSLADLQQEALTTNDPFRRELATLATTYQQELAQQHAVDFDDLLQLPVELLRRDPALAHFYQGRYDHILVDEYQDTNVAQYELLRLLAAQHRNLFVVGDEDQSIYGWRGANIRNILRFEEDFPGGRTFRLEQNYRSTDAILAVANAVITHNTERKGKTLWTAEAGGERPTVHRFTNDFDEADWIGDRIATALREEGKAADEIAVLYRTNAQSRLLERALRLRQIPFRIVGGLRFFERREIKDAMAYARLTVNPSDNTAFERIVNTPRRGVGDRSLELLRAWATTQQVPLRAAAAQATQIPGLPKAAAGALAELADLLHELDAAAEHLTVDRFLETLVERTGLKGMWAAEGTEKSDEDRLENLNELTREVREFVALRTQLGEDASLLGFLEHAALSSSADENSAVPQAQVTLMTIHSAKGLEFREVFLAGLQEGVFPHGRALGEGSPTALEEERRLFYVALTRAEETLHLSWADTRKTFGRQEPTDVRDGGAESRFLAEIPSPLRLLRDHRGETSRLPWGGGAKRPAVSPTRNAFGRPVAPDFDDDAEDAPYAAAAVRRAPTPPPAAVTGASRSTGSSLTPGTAVQHAVHGRGVVKVAIGAGAAAQVVVDFPGIGQRVVKGADLTVGAAIRR